MATKFTKMQGKSLARGFLEVNTTVKLKNKKFNKSNKKVLKKHCSLKLCHFIAVILFERELIMKKYLLIMKLHTFYYLFL